jgi:hypothetical protein
LATRSRTTFQKRQKELARLEKQRDKAARRMQRKAEKASGGVPGENDDLISASEVTGLDDFGTEKESAAAGDRPDGPA